MIVDVIATEGKGHAMKTIRCVNLSTLVLLVCAVFGTQSGLGQSMTGGSADTPSSEAILARLVRAEAITGQGDWATARQLYLDILAETTPPVVRWQQEARHRALRAMIRQARWLDDALAAYRKHPDYGAMLLLGEQLKRQGRGFEMLDLYRDYLLVGPVVPEQERERMYIEGYDPESLANRVIDEIVSVGEGESTSQQLRLASIEQPSNARLHRNLGYLLLKAAEYDEALVELDAYLATKGTVLSTNYRWLGDVCQQAGFVERAIEFYEKSLETEWTREDSLRYAGMSQMPTSVGQREEMHRAPVLRSLGSLYVRQGRLADAEACFKRLADYNTSYYREDGEAKLATLWDQMGKENAIVNDLANRVEAEPDNASLRAEYAAALFKTKRPGEAATQYTQAHVSAPDNLSLRLRLAAVLAADNQPKAALTEYLETLAVAARKDPNEFRRGKAGDETEPGRVLNTLIRFCKNRNDQDEQLECFLRVLECLDSTDTVWQAEPYSWSTVLSSIADIYRSRGEHETLTQLLLDHRRKTDRAARLLTQLPWRYLDSLDPIAQRLSDETTSDPNDLWGRMILGDLYIEQNHRTQAIGIYQRLLEDASGTSPIFVPLCERLEHLERNDLLLEAYAKELAAFKQGGRDYARKLGQIARLHLRLGDKAEAAKYYRQAIDRDPTDGQYWRGLFQATDGQEGAEALPTSPAEDLDTLRSQAQAILAGGQNSAEAATRFEQILEQAATDVKSMVSLGQAYEQLGRKDEALALYEQAYSMRQWSNGQTYDVDDHLKRLYQEGGFDDKLIGLLTEQRNYSEVSWIYQSQGHPERYESYLLDQIAARPTTSLRFNLAGYYLDNGNLDAATPVCEQLRTELTDSGRQVPNLSNSTELARLFERLGRIDEALALVTPLDYENEQDSNGWLGQLLTRLYGKAGQIENALDTCLLRLKKDSPGYRTTDIAEDTIDALPDDAEAAQRLADFLDRIETEMASRQYERFRGAVLTYTEARRPLFRRVLQGPSDPVALLKKGRRVRVPQNCRSFADFLEKLAIQAGTIATGSFMGRYGQSMSPPRIDLAEGPVYEILAAALDGQSMPMHLDQYGYWEINESGDKSRKYSYAAAGGVLWRFEGFVRPSDSTELQWYGTQMILDPGSAADVVSKRFSYTVTEVVDNHGAKVELSRLKGVVHRPAPFGAVFDDPQSLVQSVSEMHVTTSVAVCREWVDFTLERLDHVEPVVLTDNGITIRVSPAVQGAPNTRKMDQIQIDVDSNVQRRTAGLELAARVSFIHADGSRTSRVYDQAIRHPGKSIFTVHASNGSLNSDIASLVLSIPVAVEMVESELVFHDVPVIAR